MTGLYCLKGKDVTNKYIIIGADFVPTSSNQDYFCNGQMNLIVDERTYALINNASFRIFNLETPLTDKKTPIEKCGPNLIAPTQTIRGYEQLKVNLLTIGNNHILDQGEQGFISTISTLKNQGIDYVGGGTNLQDAIKPFLFEFSGKRIGIYACAEHEFSIAEENSCGANPYEPLESFDHVTELRRKCDFIVVLYHGGKELYRYPSPGLQKTCHKFIEKGANLVICQHSHCIGCEERYINGTVVYGQGNFLFDNSDSEFWKTSLLICLDEELKITYFPLVKNGNGVCAADESLRETILGDFFNRSKEILQDGFINKEYKKYANKMVPMYLMFFGARISLFYRLINRILRGRLFVVLYKILYNKALRLSLYDFITCEAHRELFREGIKEKDE